MTVDVNVSLIVQSLIVAGLLWTAQTLWSTVLKLAEVSVRVEDHTKRIERLEDR
jgi:hypothetical protein